MASEKMCPPTFQTAPIYGHPDPPDYVVSSLLVIQALDMAHMRATSWSSMHWGGGKTNALPNNCLFCFAMMKC